VTPVYRDAEFSCWQPYPLLPRPAPPVLTTIADADLAKNNQALCLVADVYHGLENVARGTIKHLRVLEQVPRPWAVRYHYLTGTPTAQFSVSYENLVPERRRPPFRDRGLLGPVIGENHPKTGNVHYLPARSLGSHASVLVAMLAPGKVQLADAKQAARAKQLAEVHARVKLTPEELLKITNWVDTNCQFYGAYWGRRHLKYQDLPDFRPTPTFALAVSQEPPK